jgi:hypothetical protein
VRTPSRTLYPHCYRIQTDYRQSTTGTENLKAVNLHVVHNLSRGSEGRIRWSRFRISGRRHATMTGTSRPLPSIFFQSIIHDYTTHAKLVYDVEKEMLNNPRNSQSILTQEIQFYTTTHTIYGTLCIT